MRAANQLARSRDYPFSESDAGRPKKEVQEQASAPIVVKGRAVVAPDPAPTNPHQDAQTTGLIPMETPAQIAARGFRRTICIVSMSSRKTDSSPGRFYPSFFRKLVAPGRHAVVTDVSDRDLVKEQQSRPPNEIGHQILGR